ncbi:TPA: hypothetical protein DCX16_06170 [bacterium]|nr:hypothetical protein [bacterium]
MIIKEWIQLTLHEMVDEIICAIRKEVGGGFLTSQSCKEIEKIIHKYGEEIFSAQNEDSNKKIKKVKI